MFNSPILLNITTRGTLLVLGGNGLVGSSICRKALNKNWKVISLSQSGKPFITSEGYTPSWVKDVDWRKGTPFDSNTFLTILPECTAVVSTLGILLESNYKSSGQVNPIGLLKGLIERGLGNRGNPLDSNKKDKVTYERINRDAALAIYDAFSNSIPTTSTSTPSPFVFVSAEDIFRPFVPSRYISTKREAERVILLKSSLNESNRSIRPIIVRPSLIYHPHLNPLSTVPATVLSLSSSIQSLLPTAIQVSSLFPPHPSSSSNLPPATVSMANLLTIPPVHVDTIAEAVCIALERESTSGVLGVGEMRKLAGYDREVSEEIV